MKKNIPNVATHLLTNLEQYLLKICVIMRKLSLDELTENFVVSNAKIKLVLQIEKFSISDKEGLIKTIKSFK